MNYKNPQRYKNGDGVILLQILLMIAIVKQKEEENVIAFTLNEDGSVNYLTKTEVDSITKNAGSEDINLEKTNSDKVMLRDYRNWYVFKQTSGPTQYVGSLKKVSADLVAPIGGGSITKSVLIHQHIFSQHQLVLKIRNLQYKQGLLQVGNLLQAHLHRIL